MDIRYSKQAVKIERLYSTDGWAAVEEEEPDEIDLEMIRELQANPDCMTTATREEVRAVLKK